MREIKMIDVYVLNAKNGMTKKINYLSQADFNSDKDLLKSQGYQVCFIEKNMQVKQCSNVSFEEYQMFVNAQNFKRELAYKDNPF